MTTNSPVLIAGAIIAGGKSNRFGSTHKGLAPLGKKTVIEHIYQRLRKQTERVWLNTQESFIAPESFLDIKVERISEPENQQNGPLAGVLAVMEETVKNHEWLLICPCDTPFIPDNLCTVLLDACLKKGVDLAIAESGGRYHPSVSLWHRSLLDDLQTAVYEQNKEGFKQFYLETNHCFVEWAVEEYDPFFNINYLEDLDIASKIIDSTSNK